MLVGPLVVVGLQVHLGRILVLVGLLVLLVLVGLLVHLLIPDASVYTSTLASDDKYIYSTSAPVDPA